MKLYAETPQRRTTQIVADALVLGWTLLWVTAGRVTYSVVQSLRAPAEQLQGAGDGVTGAFVGASKKVSALPGVGDDLASWFDQAAGSGRSISAAGASMVSGVDNLAFPLACAVALPPIFLVGCVWLWRRWQFVANVQAAQVFIDDAADLDLFALRAMSTQPMRELARIHPDPAGAWRNKDTEVIRALATLALKDEGLRPPPVKAAS